MPPVAFLAIYISASLFADSFYEMPITIAFLASSVIAIAYPRRRPLQQNIEAYSRGAGSPGIMMMIWIFILAGAFAHSAKEMGSINASVNLVLGVLPSQMLFAALFVASCVISLSIGTSVGTIVAMAPIATGIATTANIDTAQIIAIVVGGAMFGDNLSFISDTTIAATTTQRCKLSDKFKANIMIVLPVAVLLLVVYLLQGSSITSAIHTRQASPWLILPYAAVLAMALMGMNVMAVLTLGICLTGIIGIAMGAYDVMSWLKALAHGITDMGELIIITMMAGGILEVIRLNGGIRFIIQKLTAHIRGKRGAELSIGFLVALVNLCTANNTVAIITVGDISKTIGDRYGVDSRKCASLLDTFACCAQGLLPYGAQLLMAATLAGITPVDILRHMYYPVLLLLFTIAAIMVRYPKKYSL